MKQPRESVLVIAGVLLGVLLPAPSAAQVSTASAGAPPAAGAPAPLPRLAWADYDGDGLDDALSIQPGGALMLAHNRGDGNFEDRSELLPLAALGAVRHVAWSDYDVDGLADLLVVTERDEARLLRNEGAAGFVDVSALAGLEAGRAALHAAWGDHDRDGAPDLAVLSPAGNLVYRNRGDGTFDSFDLPGNASAWTSWSPLPGAASPERVGGAAAVELLAPTALDRKKDSSSDLTDTRSSDVTPTRTALVSGSPLVPGSSTEKVVYGPGSACASSVKDQATGNCVQASSVPALGALYPLGQELFIDPAGKIGINTTTPIRRLEMVDGQALYRMRSTGNIYGSVIELQNDSGSPTLLGGINFRDDTGIQGQFVYHRDDDSIATYVQGTERLRAYPDRTVVKDALDITGATGFGSAKLHADANEGGVFRLRSDATTSQETVTIYGNNNPGSQISMRTDGGVETVELLSEENFGGACLTLRTDTGATTVVLDSDLFSSAEIGLLTQSGQETVEIRAEEFQDGGQIILRKADGTPSITLDAEQGVSARITTETLEITGGADLVEAFHAGEDCVPGTVVAVDPERPGVLALSSAAYDPLVVGIVSGAGDVQPGLELGQQGVLDGDTLVALTGRVYVQCSDENGPVRPGDLLTSSSTPGQAMRASDPSRAFGAVLGKALSSLEGESGLVLVLVNLH